MSSPISILRYLPAFDAYLYEGEIYKRFEIHASARGSDIKKDGRTIKVVQVIERIRKAKKELEAKV